MNVLKNENTQRLIDELMEEGIEKTREYLSDLFNEYLYMFNQFVKNCEEGNDYKDSSYSIEEFSMGDTKITIDMLCMNYRWSTTRSGEKKYYSGTHGFIDLRDNNKFKFFQFGPNSEENKKHQEWLDNLLSREYKFKQLKIKN